MTGNGSSLQRKNALVLALALLAAAPFGWRAIAGVGLGGGIQLVNLRALEQSVALALGLAGRGYGAAVQSLLGLRFILLLGGVGLVLLTVPLDPIPVVAGLSTAVPAVLWHAAETGRIASGRGS